MSGGDRIWVECAKRWSGEPGVEVKVLTTVEGAERGHFYGLNVPYVIWSGSRFRGSNNVYILYFRRVLQGLVAAFKYPDSSEKNIAIYRCNANQNHDPIRLYSTSKSSFLQ